MAQAFVGRRTERRQLIDWLAEAAKGRPATVLVDGDAGVGKTSLMDWFAGEAANRGALVLRGSCIELGDGEAIPYGALTEALRLFIREMGPERAQGLIHRWPALGALISGLGGQALRPVPSR